jgi:hypothetical protein
MKNLFQFRSTKKTTAITNTTSFESCNFISNVQSPSVTRFWSPSRWATIVWRDVDHCSGNGETRDATSEGRGRMVRFSAGDVHVLPSREMLVLQGLESEIQDILTRYFYSKPKNMIDQSSKHNRLDIFFCFGWSESNQSKSWRRLRYNTLYPIFHALATWLVCLATTVYVLLAAAPWPLKTHKHIVCSCRF